MREKGGRGKGGRGREEGGEREGRGREGVREEGGDREGWREGSKDRISSKVEVMTFIDYEISDISITTNLQKQLIHYSSNEDNLQVRRNNMFKLLPWYVSTRLCNTTATKFHSYIIVLPQLLVFLHSTPRLPLLTGQL